MGFNLEVLKGVNVRLRIFSIGLDCKGPQAAETGRKRVRRTCAHLEVDRARAELGFRVQGQGLGISELGIGGLGVPKPYKTPKTA